MQLKDCTANLTIAGDGSCNNWTMSDRTVLATARVRTGVRRSGTCKQRERFAIQLIFRGTTTTCLLNMAILTGFRYVLVVLTSIDKLLRPNPKAILFNTHRFKAVSPVCLMASKRGKQNSVTPAGRLSSRSDTTKRASTCSFDSAGFPKATVSAWYGSWSGALSE
jgi:hypothetical protein